MYALTPLAWTYLLYLVISIPVALIVGWILYKNGRVFLMEVFQGKEDLADSVNHLLIVGAYLISIGFITFALQYGAEPDDPVGAIRAVSTKVGVVLFVLGAGHLANVLFLSRMRWRVRLVAPQGHTSTDSPSPSYGVERRLAPVDDQEPTIRVRSDTGGGTGPRDQKPTTSEEGHAAAEGDGVIAMADITGASSEVTVVATEWAFTPQVVTVKQGEPVTLVLVNEGLIEHELKVPALGLHLHAPSGATISKSFVPGRVGTFELGCEFPGHREWGMVGSLVVTE